MENKKTASGIKIPSVEAGIKVRNSAKMSRIPVRFEPTAKKDLLRKPDWIRARLTGSKRIQDLKKLIKTNQLHTVCEEADCPNLGECFESGTATFMIMGDICTRRCPFCDVGHGRPMPLDTDEPMKLADTVKTMQLNYVVVTSVDRDDLRDGGADHFSQCINALRKTIPNIQIEILTPDFRGRIEKAVDILKLSPPNVFNHNLETVPQLYASVRPGADYAHSLNLLELFKQECPETPTKSGIMLGLGETREQVVDTLTDMRTHNVDMITLGQYLQPSLDHLPVSRYWTPQEFDELGDQARSMGFRHVASGPMVRSSYHADIQKKSIA